MFKPAPETPLDAFVLAEAAEAAGVPPGVVNIVPGGSDVGAALVAHDGVDRVVFTGSTTAGRAISDACSGSFKRLTLELGGKAAAVLLDDAPIEASLASILPMSFFNSGQACIALSRVLVPRARYDEVVDAAVEATRAMTVGDPRDPATVLGPVISSHHRDRVEGMIERTRAEGGVVATGGKRPAGLDAGWYVEPTVFRDVDNTGYLAQHEVFGPVVAIIPHDGDDDAVAQSNATPYGLSGAVFTDDLDRALAFACARAGGHVRRERVRARLLVAVRRAQAVGHRARVRHRGTGREHRGQGDRAAARQHRRRLTHDTTTTRGGAAMGKLDGKVAIISGAARGQGEAEARDVRRRGRDASCSATCSTPKAKRWRPAWATPRSTCTST